MTDLGAALEHVAQPKEHRTVHDTIMAMAPELEKSLQSEQAAQTLLRHYMNAVRFNPLLMQCSAESLVAAMLLSAQVRLEPGPLGHVYLVPYKSKQTGTHEVTWILGYTGIIELARRGGATALRSTIVHEGDEYVKPWEDERGIHYKLVPGDAQVNGEVLAGVLVTWTDAKVRQALHVPPERVERARKASAAAKSASGPWVTDEAAMIRKTGVRAARPFLPLSPDFMVAVRADGDLVRGVDVIEGAAQPALVEVSPDE